MLATDWTMHRLPADLLSGAVLISGIYDPAPAIGTTVNEEIRLTAEQARRLDFERIPPLVHCPVEILVGGQEPSHWIDQSFRYAHHRRGTGSARACGSARASTISTS